MKPLIISFASLLLLISTWGFFIFYTSSTLEEMSAQLKQEVYQPIASEEWPSAASGIKHIAESWHKNKAIFYMLSNHGIVRETDLSIAKTQEFIKNQERSDALAELAAINELFISIQQCEAFSLDNLL